MENNEGRLHLFGTPSDFTAPTTLEELHRLDEQLGAIRNAITTTKTDDGITVEEALRRKTGRHQRETKEDAAIKEAAQNAEQTIHEHMQNYPVEKYEYLVRGALLECDQGSHRRRLNIPLDHAVYTTKRPMLHKMDCIPGDEHNISSFGVCNSSLMTSGPTVTLQAVKHTGEESVPTGQNVRGRACVPIIIGTWLNSYAPTKITDRFSPVSQDGGKSPLEIVRAAIDDDEKTTWERLENLVGHLPNDYNSITTASFLVCKYGGLIEPVTSGQNFVETLELENPHMNVNFNPLTGIGGFVGSDGIVNSPYTRAPQPNVNFNPHQGAYCHKMGRFGTGNHGGAFFEGEFWDPIQNQRVTLRQDFFDYPLRIPDNLGTSYQGRHSNEFNGLKYHDSGHWGYDIIVPDKGVQRRPDGTRDTRDRQPEEPFIPIVSVVDSVFEWGTGITYSYYIEGTDEYYRNMLTNRRTEGRTESQIIEEMNTQNGSLGNVLGLRSIDEYDFIDLLNASGAQSINPVRHDASGLIIARQGRRRLQFRYAHMFKMPTEVQIGEGVTLNMRALPANARIPAGTLIGYVGNTGRSSNAHLHLDIGFAYFSLSRANTVDPAQFFPGVFYRERHNGIDFIETLERVRNA